MLSHARRAAGRARRAGAWRSLVSSFTPLPARITLWSVGGGARPRRRHRHRLRRLPRRSGRAARSDHRAPGGIADGAADRRSERRRGRGRSPSTRCAPTSCARRLTILGVVIGVTTVMAIASMVEGIRTQIFNAMETAGPIAVLRHAVLLADAAQPRPPALRGAHPPVAQRDRRRGRSARLPQIALRRDVGAALPADRVPGRRTQTVTVFGADDHYMDIQGGTLLRGRFFTRGELTGRRGHRPRGGGGGPALRPDRSAGPLRPGRRRRALRVIGIYQKPANIFEPPGQQIGAVIPFETARQNYHYDETNGLFIAVQAPAPARIRARTRDLATVALRRVAEPPARHAQHLRPDHPGPDPGRRGQVHDLLLRRDGRALERGPAGRRHRRHGDHDGVGHRPHPRDRPPQGARRHPPRDPVAVPGRGRHPHASSADCSASCSGWARAS